VTTPGRDTPFITSSRRTPSESGDPYVDGPRATRVFLMV
jgi:hypothetical protein